MPLRAKAFALHLLASAAIIGGFLVLVFLLWYPQAYFAGMHAWAVLGILIGVDLIIGPLLTLIVASPAKPFAELRRDIGLIVLVQLLAFGWGAQAIYSSRPLYAVFYHGEFYVMSAPALPEIQVPDPALAPSPWRGPQAVAAVAGPGEGRAAPQLTQFYRPIADYPGLLGATGRALAAADNLPPAVRERLAGQEQQEGGAYRVYPGYVMGQRYSLVFDTVHQRVVDILTLPAPAGPASRLGGA
jgi:hypothetical protein